MVATKKYKIMNRLKGSKRWEVERFQTGGRVFTDYKTAQAVKKKLNSMSSSIEYKVQ